MSNVLIGIIGVILFIGLALAGALFLGPRFQDATNTSKASAYVSQGKQIADAMQMYRVQEGTVVPINTPIERFSGSYLKSVPNGWFLYSLGPPVDAAVAGFTVIPDNTQNRSICLKIQIESGQVPRTMTTMDATPSTIRDSYLARNYGCLKYDDTQLAVWAAA
jgi:type II secretory pathway pseudopilin PulG